MSWDLSSEEVICAKLESQQATIFGFSKMIKILEKENKLMHEGLQEISKGRYEANPWTIVPTSDALIAKKILEEIGEAK
jgi:hypothetical protein